jgi:diguanylate cyclase (GGDEF)-like protein
MANRADDAAETGSGPAAGWMRWLAVAICWLALAPGTLMALPTLTSARAVHQLSMAEAALGYPILLRAMVTYYDPYLDYPQPILMVTDGTGSIFVKLPQRTDLHLKAGQRVEVRGQSVAGGFAPDVDRPQIRVVGESALPRHARLRTLTYLLLGAEDAPLVEMGGVIHTVEESAHDVILKIAGSDGIFTAVTPRTPGVEYQHLVNERVRILGLACSLFNKRRQIVGVQLRFADLTMVTVESEKPALPFDLPRTAMNTLFHYTPGQPFDRLVHLRGVVTMFWPGRLLCLQQGADSLCAQTAQTGNLQVGQEVDLTGFPMTGNYAPILVDAAYRGDGRQGRAHPAAIDPEQGLHGESDAKLVSVEGRVIGLDKGADDASIVFSSGKYIFAASLPSSSDSRALAGLEAGSLVKITGICSVQADPRGITDADGYKVAKSFRILLRSSGDLEVLKRPSWWNARHTLYVLMGALILISCALAWVLVLRRRLKLQTGLLEYQSTHDGLTGLWNRMAILELLARECELAARSQGSVGIMMLDADHFKHVNDSHGHMAGDVVLRTISSRIAESVRATDLVGRYGGEEFLIVLPGCDVIQTEAIAERARQAVAEQPVSYGERELIVTVSIGMSVLEHFLMVGQDAALAAADKALYGSKNAGRNRVTYLAPRLHSPHAEVEEEVRVPVPG